MSENIMMISENVYFDTTSKRYFSTEITLLLEMLPNGLKLNPSPEKTHYWIRCVKMLQIRELSQLLFMQHRKRKYETVQVPR